MLPYLCAQQQKKYICVCVYIYIVSTNDDNIDQQILSEIKL